MYFPSAAIEMLGYLCMTLAASALLRLAERRMDGEKQLRAGPGRRPDHDRRHLPPPDPPPRTKGGADMTLEPILECATSPSRFGTHQVLRDVNFTVHPGDVTSILGSSGSGKSTPAAVHQPAGAPQPGGGPASIGRSITGRGTDASALPDPGGMVFQSFNLFSNMNVLENCMAGPVKVLRRSREEGGPGPCATWSRWAWRPTSMPGPGSSPAARSSGWPLPVPWPWSRRCSSSTSPPPPWIPRWWEVLAVMRALAASGMTMLVVTHEMAFARDVSSQVSFMADGRICESGAPDAFFSSPASPEPGNFWPGLWPSNRPAQGLPALAALQVEEHRQTQDNLHRAGGGGA